MIADYFTKPLQGRLFHKFRSMIMNVPYEETTYYKQRAIVESELVDTRVCADTRKSPQECVTRGGLTRVVWPSSGEVNDDVAVRTGMSGRGCTEEERGATPVCE